MDNVERVANAICKCKAYNSPNGTCAAICMEKLGDARSGAGCPHAKNVHGRASRAAIAAIEPAIRAECAAVVRKHDSVHSDWHESRTIEDIALEIESQPDDG